MSDEFRVCSWNVEKGAADDPGRWESAMRVLTDLGADVVLRQEMRGAELDGYARLHAEEKRLGMVGFLAEDDPGERPTDSGVFVRPQVQVVAVYRHRRLLWHPICNPVVLLPGASVPLSLASFHLAYFGSTARMVEAEFLTTLGKPGMFSILGGDCNSFPVEDEAGVQDWSTVTDTAYIAHRTLLPEPDQAGRFGTGLRADTRPDQILRRVFTDAAQRASILTDSAAPLAPTGGGWRTDQGAPRRIDRIYLTPSLVSALLSVQVIDTEQARAASDHLPVLARFDRAALIKILSRRPATDTTIPTASWPVAGGVR